MFLENISKDFTTINIKKTELTGYVYEFSVDYDIIDTSNLISIPIYLAKKMILSNAWNYQKKVYCIIN